VAKDVENYLKTGFLKLDLKKTTIAPALAEYHLSTYSILF
jgi:hypothetical protein